MESEQVIAEIVRNGMASYPDDKKQRWEEVFSRIEVINTSYQRYFLSQSDMSFDVVYFDPMFKTPVTISTNINPPREWANYEEVTCENVKQACRIARRRVVIKSVKNDTTLEDLGFTKIESKKRICYGYIDVKQI